jgi:hypothetical protein
LAGVPTFFGPISSRTRHSIAYKTRYGATLIVKVSNNPNDVLPLFLALLYRYECELMLATLLHC